MENLVSKNVDKSTIIHLVSFKEIHIPVFIMTSEFNNQAIIDDILSLIQLFTFIILFCKHDYYGLEKDQVVFFSQGSLPCVDERGHFIMRKQHQVRIFSFCSSRLHYHRMEVEAFSLLFRNIILQPS